MALDGKQFEQIHNTLLSAYDEAGLQQMVRFELNEGLDIIARPGRFSDRVFDLVGWADRSGRERDLVQAACKRNPTNPALLKLHAALFPPGGLADRTPKLVTGAVCPQIFLSYCHDDSETTQRLLDDFADAGLSAWTDEGLEPGSPSWQVEIKMAIQRTECMVVILSPEAEQSEWVNIEVSYARALGRRVFPLLIRGEKVDAIPLILFNTQYVDARQDYAQAVVSELLPALTRYLKTVGVAPSERATEDAERKVSQTSKVLVKLGREPNIDFDWAKVPAGEFLMGSDKEKDAMAEDRELPQHAVYLDEYLIARTPVTNIQYKAFVDASGYETPENWENGQIPWGKEDHPVVYVSWHDAQSFCAWAGVRLPTEAEWEKAARGTDGRIYPWGEESPTRQLCNFNMDLGSTGAVGRYSPLGDSPYGVADMAGNIWEWTYSQYMPYLYDPSDGRENRQGDNRRTIRGGSWSNYEHGMRCATRGSSAIEKRSANLGFRVNMSP